MIACDLSKFLKYENKLDSVATTTDQTHLSKVLCLNYVPLFAMMNKIILDTS